MKQHDLNSPSLCGYLNFYHVLSEMESESLISIQEKKIIKQKLTLKEPSLLMILTKQQDDEKLKQDLLGFTSSLQLTRSKSHTSSLSPCKQSEVHLMSQTLDLVDKLTKSLKFMIHQKNQITEEFEIKIRQLKDVLYSMETEKQVETELAEQLQVTYTALKQRYCRYMNSLLVLMDEKVEPKNIQEFLNTFLNQLIGCNSYSYIILKDLKLLIHKDTQLEQFDLTKDLLEELINLQQPTDLQQLINMRRYFRHGNYILKLSDTEYFVLELDEQFTDFVTIAKQYNYMDSLHDICQFVMHTSQQIKVQYFSILSIGDTVLEIGLDIVRCSKYLFIDKILTILKQKYTVEKTNEPQQVTIKFKDSSLYQVNMNLQNPTDLLVYNQCHLLYQRYQQFIKQCYERMIFFKYFLRSKNLFMIDFDKQGRLRFLSRALSQKIKQQFHIEKTQIDQTYKQIFASNQQMLTNIENYISNSKWKLQSQEDEQQRPYEIFIRKEEKRFKGFTVIISENEWVRRKTQPPFNGKTVRQQLLQTETMDYIKKLEEFNPDIRNSVVAMYMPQVQEINLVPQQMQKTPTLVFRKLDTRTQDKEKLIGKNSFIFKQREEERKQMRMNPNKFNETHLILKEEDEIFDTLDFNIHLFKTTVEKQRIVWAILERNKYIQMFALPTEKLINFLNEIESQYNMNNNPYHNYDHGIAVMQSVNCFIKNITSKLGEQFFNNTTKFCLLLSALCHDVAHTGRTNSYEANSLSQLAIRYHDKVVLEQHHAATTVKILRETNTNMLCNFSDADFKSFRKQLIQNILATDMQEHFKMLKEFESRIEQFGNDPEDLSLLCGMITHTADFNGTARKWPQSRLWSEKINQEYRAQYEEEGKRGYVQQPFMKDLDKLHVMAKNEMGFIKVIVRPLYHQMNCFGKGAFQVCVDNLDETIFEWDKLYQQETQQQEQQK